MASKWIELFLLISPTKCAIILTEEIYFKYGLSSKLICASRFQFVSATLQQIYCTLNIHQVVRTVYYSQVYLAEGTNKDL